MNWKSSVLIEAGIKGGSAYKHKWTDDERDIVRRDYDGTNKTAQRIADNLGVTFNAVKGQAGKMGIRLPKSPAWTEAEIERLSEMITVYNPSAIAKRLNRSVNAVVVKSKRLGLSRRARDGWFTKREVCEIMGVDHKRIQRDIDKGKLKARYHSEVKPSQNGASCWHIKQEDLIEFIKNNTGDFLGRNVDLITIVWLLSGGM